MSYSTLDASSLSMDRRKEGKIFFNQYPSIGISKHPQDMLLCLGSSGGRNCPGLKELTVRSLPYLPGCTYCFSRPTALQQDQTGRKKQGYPLSHHPGIREPERPRELSYHQSQQELGQRQEAQHKILLSNSSSMYWRA